MNNMTKHIALLVVILLFFNCKEEIELATESFENVLVVEATIVNQLEFQKIKLSRTYFLEGNDQVLENNATVKVIDDTGNIFNFTQNTEGIYVSDIEFQALPNTLYSLLISTSDGKSYNALKTELTPISQIDNLYTEYDSIEEHVKIFVDSENANTGAQYFRYQYDETYKIVTPYHSPYDAIVTNVANSGDQYDVELVVKTEDERTCFTTKPSIDIIQTATDQLENDIVFKFPIRTISKHSAIIRERYSILVRQYVQTLEAYNYYKTIKELSVNESVLSENQPGFVTGNIISLNSETEKVIGFFEVASVSSERIYFNYLDLGITQPNYFFDCEYKTDEGGDRNYNPFHRKLDYEIVDGLDHRGKLYRALTHQIPEKYINREEPYTYDIVIPECGDCTSFSSNIQPDFWID